MSEENKPQGLKFDSTKTQPELIPADSMWALGLLYARGARKYGLRNWEDGNISVSRYLGAIMRHYLLFAMGEDIDAEMKLPHMTAVAWNAIAIDHLIRTGKAKDDRGKMTQEEIDALKEMVSEVLKV